MNAKLPTRQNRIERVIHGLLALALLAGVMSALFGAGIAPEFNLGQLLA